MCQNPLKVWLWFHNILFRPNFFGPKIFFGPNIFVEILFWRKIGCGPKISSDKYFFLPKIFFGPNICSGLKDFHLRLGIKPFQAEHFRFKSLKFVQIRCHLLKRFYGTKKGQSWVNENMWRPGPGWPWQTSSGKSVLANPLWSTINSTLFSSRETTEWLFFARLETLEKQSKF